MAPRLTWSDPALDDLRAIRAGLTDEAAARVGRLICDSADCLAEYPERGRAGHGDGIRELPLPGLPWRLVYRGHDGADVVILRLL
ncbi:type II toxin-antitoxin system RelE/ParE family toxin [Magnetospirillum sp. SS-4]|uniref:type II toxin-antitoxin system RelE/ParE family toxin n=1 Tax=Magnetospirillum sp. SS-4 TaxID=2681465 RepID=UPI00137F1C0A|nr:type II toxin-antitoxin system RelE/ParE family toxin [Magnetospirillum sp. SS-4]CAA7619824.1 Plasmid stabilization system [Magnetospirillum sp. SS-4]